MSMTPDRQPTEHGPAAPSCGQHRLHHLHLGHNGDPQRGGDHPRQHHPAAAGTRRLPGAAPEQVWTQCHSYGFDFSVWEIWGALLHGGRLVMIPESIARSPAEFHALLVAEGVDVLGLTPSAAAVMSPQGLESMTCGAAARPARSSWWTVGPRRARDDQRLRPDRDDGVCVVGAPSVAGSGMAPIGAAVAGAAYLCWMGGCGRCRRVWSVSCMSPAPGWGAGIGVGRI